MTDTEDMFAARGRYFRPAVAAICVLAVALALFATGGHGAGVSPDSVYYLEGAANLRAGRGYAAYATQGQFAPITHWPPGYSLALAAANFGGEMLETARRLNALLFGLNVLLAAWLVRRYSGSALAGVATAMLAAAGQPMLEVHTTAWSEPLFFALALGACTAFGRFRDSGRWPPLLAAALLAGLALLVRFAAAALMGALLAALIATLAATRGPLFKRRFKAGAFTLLALTPLAAWMMTLGAGGRGSRKFEFLGAPGMDAVADAAHSLSLWILPHEAPGWLRALAVGAAGLALLALAARAIVNGWRAWRGTREPDPSDMAQQFVVVFAVCYLGVVLASMMILDPEVVLDGRTLSPLYLGAAMLGPPAAAQMFDAGKSGIGVALLCGLTACFGGGLAQSVRLAQEVNEHGAGLNSTYWKEDRFIRELQALPEGTLAYTNQIAAVRYLTKCDVRALPPLLTSNRDDGNPPRLHPEYFPRMKKALETLTRRGGALAAFPNAEWYYRMAVNEQAEVLEQLTEEQRAELKRLWRSAKRTVPLYDHGSSFSRDPWQPFFVVFEPTPIR